MVGGSNFHPKMLRDRNYFRLKLLDDSDVPCMTQYATRVDILRVVLKHQKHRPTTGYRTDLLESMQDATATVEH